LKTLFESPALAKAISQQIDANVQTERYCSIVAMTDGLFAVAVEG